MGRQLGENIFCVHASESVWALLDSPPGHVQASVSISAMAPPLPSCCTDVVFCPSKGKHAMRCDCPRKEKEQEAEILITKVQSGEKGGGG